MAIPRPPRYWWKLFRATLLILLLALLLGYFGVGYVVIEALLSPRASPLTQSPDSVGLPYEALTLHSADGTALAAWYIPHDGSQRAIVLVHGKDSNRSHFVGSPTHSLSRDLHEAGFALLLLDLRAHGASEGRYSTLGWQERWDVSAGVAWLAAQGHTGIGVLGTSLGGASSAEALAVNEQIDALVLDSAYPDLRRLLDARFPELTGLPAFFLPGTLLVGEWLLGTDIDAVKPAARVAQAGKPLLVIYGERDNLIPQEFFGEFEAAAPHAMTWIVPAAYHSNLYGADPEGYAARVRRFFEATLP